MGARAPLRGAHLARHLARQPFRGVKKRPFYVDVRGNPLGPKKGHFFPRATVRLRNSVSGKVERKHPWGGGNPPRSGFAVGARKCYADPGGG